MTLKMLKSNLLKMKNNNEIELTEDEEIAIVEKRIDHVHNLIP
jgi:hypothetical protein